MDHQCQCDCPGWCDILKRKMNARAFAVCQGKNPDGTPMDPYRHAMFMRLLYKQGGVEKPVESKFATPEQFPCIFRESVIEEVPCQICGQRDKKTDLYACGLHGKCTVGSHGVTYDGTNATAKVKVCISCDDRNEVG